MKKFVFVFVVILLFLGCSEDKSPVSVKKSIEASGFIMCKIDNDAWHSTDLSIEKSNGDLILTSMKDDFNGYNSKLEIKFIKIQVPQLYGVGEDEPGFKYVVRSYLTLEKGNIIKDYTVLYDDYSLINLTQFDDNNIDATFKFRAFNSDSTEVFNITDGIIKIEYD